MKFFIDSADIGEIKELQSIGFADGVTTNPSIIAKSGLRIVKVIEEICSIVEGPVSAEVTATDTEGMLKEALYLKEIADNVAIKVPLTKNGLKVSKILSDQGTLVNVTLCFSPGQALAAAKTGAAFVSPFVGRLDDIASNGMDLISDIVHTFSAFHHIKTEILVASVRNPQQIIEAAKAGADIVTAPPKIFWALLNHPLTEIGLEKFLSDWKESGQTILPK